MAPSAIDPREEQKRTVMSARIRTNGITKNTATKPKMNKATEDLVRPMEGLVLEKTVDSSSTTETMNVTVESKDTDMNTVYNEVFSNLRGHFQKPDIVKPDVGKSDITKTVVENKVPKKKIIDQDEDAAYDMIKAHFRSMGSGGKKGGANKWSFLI
ncbi:uncharacterized protein EAF01_011296 [Botrytis porri]|uniref:Uncharacterized protein n=1 Tax=Botrytis porri TaxID=87229 RepID=A0A4Z1KKR6_9HELO|nr:uncharacterized protein EAF01_011296 [Botrytis porri]KAF7886618.1 hypothetical protein EAF01_011296 [Botrytis porri]TGO86661.1 hypothetical protein BPOR_0286g00110 [Botrytis porri]